MTSEYVAHPEVFEMAQFIYKRPDKTKAVEYYSRAVDTLGYEINPTKRNSRNFHLKYKYAHNIKNIDTDNIDKLADNKTLMEPQYMYRRNRLLTSLSHDAQTEQSTFTVRNYSMIQKSGTSFIKEWKNDKKINKLGESDFTVKGGTTIKSKIGNDSKSVNIAMNIAKVEKADLPDYLSKMFNITMTNSTEEPTKPTTKMPVYKPFFLSNFFGFIPRFDYNLKLLKDEDTKFNPFSTKYKFVSNHSHL